MSGKSIGLDKLKDTFTELNDAFGQWDKLTKELLNTGSDKKTVEKRTQELIEEVKKQLEVFSSEPSDAQPVDPTRP